MDALKVNLKNIRNKIGFSHIACLAIGALIPIYSDLLLLHGYDSSTTSAIMDTVMAAIAFITVFKVYRWLDSKLNEKGFEQANLYISYFIEAKVKAEILHTYINDMYEMLDDRDLSITDNEYKNKHSIVKGLHADYKDHMRKLKSQLDILRVWNIEVHPNKCNELEECIKHYYNFIIISDKMISTYQDIGGMARKKNWEFHDLSFKPAYALTQFLPSAWLTSWRVLFRESKSANTN